MKKQSRKIGAAKDLGEFALQPILFTGEQYKELLRAVSMYTLVKQGGVLPYTDPTRLMDSVLKQGEKFEFEKSKMDEMKWFQVINDEVFNALADYTEDEMWQVLAQMLAHRDVAHEIGEATGLSEEEMPPDMFFDGMMKRVAEYLKEFEKNGINNVSVAPKNFRKNILKIKSE